MFLYQNREVKSEGRFAIEVKEDGWHQRQRAKGTGQSTICRAISKMIMSEGNCDEAALKIINAPHTGSDKAGAKATGNHQKIGIYISPEAFYEQMILLFAGDRQIRLPSMDQTSKILRDLFSEDKLRYRVKGSRVRGGKLDLKAVVNILYSNNFNCDFSEQLGDVWMNEVPEHLRMAIEADDLVEDPVLTYQGPHIAFPPTPPPTPPPAVEE
jgi:hypothetical protein